MKKFTNKNRKAFSLVELVVVILIIAVLAVAVFAGGSKTIRKSQVSRTVSDLHNFSIAAETLLNEHPEVANIATSENAKDIVAIKDAMNKLLSADYQLKTTAEAATGNITKNATTTGNDSTYVIYESAKTDAWGNPYFVIFDTAEHNNGTEFYVTVVSAGPNAKTDLDEVADKTGTIDSDDIFMIAEYKSGDVASATYDWSTATLAPVNISGGTVRDVYVGTGANYNF